MKRSCAVLVVAVISIVIVLLSHSRAAAETCARWIGKAVSVQGSVEVRRTGETRWLAIRLNDVFCPGDAIRVQEKSRAAIILMNESTLRLDQNTSITFSKIEEEKTSVIDLITGIAHFFSRIPRSLKVSTPFVNGTVEGTEFLVSVEKDKTVLSVFEGQVIASNEAGSITLSSGQSAVAEKGQAPLVSIVVRPRDAVQWALYYPVISYASQAEWQTKVTSLLSVGRVDEASKVIEKILSESPNNSYALAFQAVIALALNEQDKALSVSKRAVEADPRSSSACIALSYALQAHFDLKGALDSLQDAVKLDPENALAWARLSELWMSEGYLGEALKAAHKAVALNPNVARTQTVLGFAYLTQIKTRASREAFEKAIELDQADPLPRLGLGLAKIRDGELEAGREEIEIAASLDPNNSLIRSYLGKAFYEEKREQKASNQYTTAKELDPLDPTPFFYDAILKQSLNRPVEALHDLQKAIEFNDNRSIYRSKLLLDSDLAARSASLATIYGQLGFQQAALAEGWKSVNADPSNFSGHRFLADSYYALPRHEIARVSELLQSQLLQPININPVQPSLGEANLFILNGAGPSDPSFNEFNPLFNRNGLSLYLSGIAGENSTFGEEIVQSGIYGGFSYSLGQFQYKTNGFRENNDQKQNIYDVFAQYSFSEKTSVQAEFKYKETDNGDLALRFNPENFSPNLRQKEDTDFFRLGLKHAFAPNSVIIASFMFKELNATAHEVGPFDIVNISDKEHGYMAEVQHLFRSERVNLISGLGYFNADSRISLGTEITDSPMTLSDVTESNVRHTNLYLYPYINYPKTVTLTLGASVDLLKGGGVDRNQFNPKLGLTWNPLPDTTIRGAVFKVLKRSLLSSQTLEPTQVAGFNQFFDDAEGTTSWNYGIAVDQKFFKDLYGGIELSQRDLEVPFLQVPVPPAPPVPEVKQGDLTERQARAYLYWTPHPWLAVSAEYLYEHSKNNLPFGGPEGIQFLKTQRFPLGVNFYHPSGFFARVRATYVNQQGAFMDSSSNAFVSDSDRFWVVDGSIGYRLPRRLGIITILAKNLFNESFRFQDTDPANPTITPKRSVFGKLTLWF